MCAWCVQERYDAKGRSPEVAGDAGPRPPPPSLAALARLAACRHLPSLVPPMRAAGSIVGVFKS